MSESMIVDGIVVRSRRMIDETLAFSA